VRQRQHVPKLCTMVLLNRAASLVPDGPARFRFTPGPFCVAAICCAVAITAFIVQSPLRLRVNLPSRRIGCTRCGPFQWGSTSPLEAQPSPPSGSVTPQEQQQSAKSDPAQHSRAERVEARTIRSAASGADAGSSLADRRPYARCAATAWRPRHNISHPESGWPRGP
jgi:hypothetical protein